MASSQSTDLVPTSVYRYFDKRDLLVYVGVTSRGIQRNREHNTDKSWWQYVVRQDVEHFGSREEALTREKGLISSYQPPFNRQHNPAYEQSRAAYLALVQLSDLPSETTPRALWDQFHHQLPLYPLSKTITGGRIALRTDPGHQIITPRLHLIDGAKVIYPGKVSRGTVEKLSVHFPYAILHVTKNPPYEVLGGHAQLKMTSQKPESFGVAQVHILRGPDL